MASKEKLKRQVKRQIEATDTEVENFVLRLDRFLNRNLQKILKDVLKGKTGVGESAQILGGIFSSLEEAGLKNEISKLETVYGKELKKIREDLELFSGKEVPLSDFDIESTEALIKLDTSKIANRVLLYTDDLSSVVMRGVITGEIPDFGDLTDSLGSRLSSNIETEISTAMMAFNRTVSVTKGEELGLDLYLYVGPDDSVTREFCQGLVDQVFSIDEIKAMDNGQGLDVLTYGGGYNCRHHWRPVTLETAKEFGYEE